MTYLVMECHLGYAIVLDSEGRFLKVANRNYVVGQTVNQVFELSETPKRTIIPKHLFAAVSTLAAVAVMVLIFVFYPPMAKPFATVNLKINPEVTIELDKEYQVTKVSGVNTDGKILITNYDYEHKKLEQVTDELVAKAIRLGYLVEGGRITISFDSKDAAWTARASHKMKAHMTEFMSDKVKSIIVIGDKNNSDYQIINPNETHVETPDSNKPKPPIQDSDYKDSDYDDSDYEDTDYEDSDDKMPDHQDGDTDYEERSDDEDSDDEDSDYEDSDYEDSDYQPPAPNEPDADNQQPSPDDFDSDYQEPAPSEPDSDYEDSDYEDSDYEIDD